jgi:hypothetical protein
MKKVFISLAVMLLTLGCFSACHAFVGSVYGTWEINGTAVESYWIGASRVQNQMDFSVEFMVGDQSWEELLADNPDSINYQLVDSYDDALQLFNQLTSGPAGSEIVPYINIPEELSNPYEWTWLHLYDEAIPGFGTVDGFFKNGDESIWFWFDFDNFADPGYVDYRFEGLIDKSANESGGYNFTLNFDDMNTYGLISDYGISVTGTLNLTSATPIVPDPPVSVDPITGMPSPDEPEEENDFIPIYSPPTLWDRPDDGR